MDFMLKWEYEGDTCSFEDSDRFDEDSLCSWISEPESLCNNWRGWKRQNGGQAAQPRLSDEKEKNKVIPLVELSAKCVACHIPFEVVEHHRDPIPEQLQLRITFWSFPENEEDIRLYSCLANGSADEFTRGDHLYRAKAVKDVLQIGFHLSATVTPPQSFPQGKGNFNVAVVFDRRRISSCNCTCSPNASWCCHVVAVCLYRIHQANSVCLRAPVSETLSRLHRDQLQKFAQYLITELPQQILPTAQRLLDELLSAQETTMNSVCGAPDPTAGPPASEQTSWWLDGLALHENVKKTLVKFCVPSPMVYSDVNYLSASSTPPAAAEWQSLLRPLRGREPEGMWNLLSIVREMFRRHDNNSVLLLEILTGEVLQCEQILIWWFTTKSSAANNTNVIHCSRSGNSSASATPHAAASLCEEIVMLWRLAALNPKLSPIQRDDLRVKFKDWHVATIEKVKKARSNSSSNSGNNIRKSDIENFPGFKPALEACQMTWDDYYISGITYSQKDPSHWHVHLRSQEGEGKKISRVQPVTLCSEDIISTDKSRGSHVHPPRGQDFRRKGEGRMLTSRHDSCLNDGAMSSGSEGFCELERGCRDSDSSCDNKGYHSRSNSLDEPDLGQAYNNNRPKSLDSDDRGDGDVFDDGDLDDVALAGSEADPEGAQLGKTLIAVMERCKTKEGAVGAVGGGEGAMAGAEGGQVPETVAEHSTSESQQSSDEYQVYFYDVKAKPTDTDKKKKDRNEEPDYFAGLRQMESRQDILFARAEALHAHGHTKDACKLARELAEEMLANPPDLLAESAAAPSPKSQAKKRKSVLMQVSLLASATLAKAHFLCTVLSEDTECHHLAFKTGMFGLELARPPASSKALEVKLAHQESELLGMLKRIPLGPAEMAVLRQRAEQLRDGKLQSRGDALLPLHLAMFIFDSLCLGARNAEEKLGFEAAVTALGLKANVSEADHPLLCESTRRQRGDLAIAMLMHYKDDHVKLSKIMDKLLDKEVHQQYKAPSLVTYLSSKGGSSSHAANHSAVQPPSMPSAAPPPSPSPPQAEELYGAEGGAPNGGPQGEDGDVQWPDNRSDHNTGSDVTPTQSLPSGSNSSCGGARPKTSYTSRYNHYGKDTDSSALEEEGDDLKALEAKIRCMGMKKKPSQGMASIDSSAPETTSSDNSPTLVRRNFGKHAGPGSDSGSSGESDSLGSSSSGDKGNRGVPRDSDGLPPPGLNPRTLPPMIAEARSSTPNIKGIRYKGKNRIMPTVPNQPSEALAHFMYELAKTVLQKAGGNSSTSHFTQPSSSTSHSGPHRHLHLCAFQIGLYALGLQNCVSPNWLSRTYSSHVSWITGQALEIGSTAIRIIIDTWEGHLTPPEVADLADKASRGRDPNMVKAAAELALSCLPHAHALNPTMVQRALYQCKEQSREMLERACLAVETAAEGGGVFPEVLFDVAKHWYELSEEAAAESGDGGSDAGCQGARGSALRGADLENAMGVVAIASPPVGQLGVENNVVSSHQLLSFSQAAPVGCLTSQAPASAAPQLLTPSSGGQLAPHQAIVLPYALPPQGPPQLPHSAYVQSYSYVQQVPASAFSHYSQHHIPLHTHTLHPHPHPHTHPYVAPYAPYQGQPPFQGIQNLGGQVYHPSAPTHARGLGGGMQVYPPVTCQVSAVQNLAVTASSGHLQPGLGSQPCVEPMVVTTSAPGVAAQGAGGGALLGVPCPGLNQATMQNQAQLNYLMAVFRVGMAAMDTLARRVHDDRPQTKYARNPPYGEDVKWLLGIAIKLGTSYLQQFCANAVNAVVSPFVLYDLAFEAARCMARNNPTHIPSQLRSNILNSLFQKCLQMFMQCAHQRIHHITHADFDEFVGIIVSARSAFYMSPGGMVQFNELLQSLRRSKSCRKELWSRIVTALSGGSV